VDGKRYSVYTFDNDIVKMARFFDKSGKEIGSSERKSKKLDLTTYYTDGFRHSQAVYNDKGAIIGPETYYYRSGKSSSENTYEDGQLEGPGFNYYSNGNKQVSTYYKAGEKHGYEKYWYSHGQLQEEGWYQNGMLQGIWLSYDEQVTAGLLPNT
jgi:antitoxin component YwqK of YwqJK toxin-antitoxin module